jgi:hypothetical protein
MGEGLVEFKGPLQLDGLATATRAAMRSFFPCSGRSLRPAGRVMAQQKAPRSLAYKQGRAEARRRRSSQAQGTSR